MTSNEFQKLCIETVKQYANEHLDTTDSVKMSNKKKMRDITPEELEKWCSKIKNCDYCSCQGCNKLISKHWVNHKDLYSDKFLDQEIEAE